MKNKKYKNVNRYSSSYGKIIDAYKWAYDFLLQSYKWSGAETAHPKDMTRAEIIEYGVECLNNDDDYINV